MPKVRNRTHIMRAFDEDLMRLRSLVVQMGEAVVEQTRDALAAVVAGDTALATQVIEREPDIDRLNMAADEEVFSVIARRQPAAVDLRLLLATAKVVSDLERAADKAERVARVGLRLAAAGGVAMPEPVAAALVELERIACCMLERSVAALTDADLTIAIGVFEDEVRLREAANALNDLLVAETGGLSGVPLAALLTASHALERVGCHGGNIAEQLVYVITGEDARYRNRELLIDALRHRGT